MRMKKCVLSACRAPDCAAWLHMAIKLLALTKPDLIHVAALPYNSHAVCGLSIASVVA